MAPADPMQKGTRLDKRSFGVAKETEHGCLHRCSRRWKASAVHEANPPGFMEGVAGRQLETVRESQLHRERPATTKGARASDRTGAAVGLSIEYRSLLQYEMTQEGSSSGGPGSTAMSSLMAPHERTKSSRSRP